MLYNFNDMFWIILVETRTEGIVASLT